MLVYRFAILCAFATFLLLLVGATVNPTGSSLACPEPTLICHGEFFPEMTGGVFYEHGHRLVAMTVGFLQMILSLLLWRRGARKIAVIALSLVCIQGVLGAITVYLKLPAIVSIAHLALAMIYFATLLYIVRGAKERVAKPTQTPVDPTMKRWIAIATGAVFAQILLGALVRHTESSLACTDLPLCSGSAFFPGDEVGVYIHMFHRMVGVLVAVIVFAAAHFVWRRSKGLANEKTYRLLAVIAPLMVLLQITLGALTVYYFRPVPLAVAHFGGAAILWCVFVSLYLMSSKFRFVAWGTLADSESSTGIGTSLGLSSAAASPVAQEGIGI